MIDANSDSGEDSHENLITSTQNPLTTTAESPDWPTFDFDYVDYTEEPEEWTTEDAETPMSEISSESLEDMDSLLTSTEFEIESTTSTEYLTETSTVDYETSTLFPVFDFTTELFDWNETSETSETIETTESYSTTTQGETNAFYELQLKYQAQQVEEVRLIHIIRHQNEMITELQQEVLSLQSELRDKAEKLKKFELKDKRYGRCRKETNLLRNFKALEKFSPSLKEKLREFDGFETLQTSRDNKSVMLITSFVVENDDHSVNILSNLELTMLPPGLGQLFPYIEELIASCGLVDIAPMAFEGFRALKSLNLSRNNFVQIENGLFEDLETLQNLDLSRNQISILNNGSFFNLNELRYLNLAHNQIETFPADVFREIGTLEVLIMSHNKLRHLNDEFLSEINIMHEFHCDHNNLVSINPNIIAILESVFVLDLSANICIDEAYPDTVSMVSLVLKVAQDCKIKL